MTGAGDSFAGGVMGYLDSSYKSYDARLHGGRISESSLRQAIIFGSVMASFNVESFSLNRLAKLNYDEIANRYREFKKLTHFEDL